MDVFAGFHGRVLAAVQQLKHDGVVPAEASIEGIALEPPKDSSRMATSPPTPPWFWPSPRGFRPARLPSASCRCSPPTRTSTRSRSPALASSISRSVCASGRPCCAWCWSRATATARAPSARAKWSTSNMSRPIRPGRCMSAIAAAPCSAMRSRACSPSPASTSRANIMSMTQAPRSMRSPAQPISATARRSVRISARFPKASIPATI